MGGVGYTKNNNINVDDIFIPTNIAKETAEGNISIEKIQNKALDNAETKYFKDKKIATGTIKTVVPRLGLLSNTGPYTDFLEQIDAFDMELEAIALATQSLNNIELAAAYYIMDNEKKGLPLGKTYYDMDFLKNLFGAFPRGKHQCYEIALNFLLQD